MQKTLKPFALVALLLSTSLIAGCAPARRDVLVASCPQPPLIPAFLKDEPASLRVDIEDLTLRAVTGYGRLE